MCVSQCGHKCHSWFCTDLQLVSGRQVSRYSVLEISTGMFDKKIVCVLLFDLVQVHVYFRDEIVTHCH